MERILSTEYFRRNLLCVCVCVCAHTRACAPLKLPVQCFAFILSRHFEFYESTRRFEAREDRRHFSILFSKRDAIIKQHRTFYFRSKYYKNTRFVFFFFFFREFNGISIQFLISHYLEAFLFFLIPCVHLFFTFLSNDSNDSS